MASKCWIINASPLILLGKAGYLHLLGNLAEAVLKEDTDLRGWMKQDLGGLAAVPTEVDPAEGGVQTGQAPESPLF